MEKIKEQTYKFARWVCIGPCPDWIGIWLALALLPLLFVLSVWLAATYPIACLVGVLAITGVLAVTIY